MHPSRVFSSFIVVFILLYSFMTVNTFAICCEASCEKMVYGKTGTGRELTYYKIEPYKNNKKVKSTNRVLLTFEIHGYEDSYNKDGRVLVDIGNYIVDYFSKNKDKLYNTTLYVICMANPDGLLDGNTNNGKGRCQTSLGIDINRDFNYKFKHFDSKRYYNLKKPLGSPEAKCLKNLVLEVKPDIVIDFHGWMNMTIGDKGLSKVFHDKLNLKRCHGFSGSTPGYFSAWASTVCKSSLMVEYPKECSKKSDSYKSSTVNALIEIFKAG